jgi:hypothetical protein
MQGEIRLGFFVDGIGWWKDCSELIYTLDSSTDSRYFKEGQVIEVDHAFFKVRAIEIQYIPLPWEGKGEKPNRDKPIKIIYVSKAKIGMMGDKRRKEIVAINTIPKLKDLPEFDISQIVDDTEYSQEDFKDDFGYLESEEAKKKKKKEAKKLAKADLAMLRSLKKRKKIATPKKEEKPAKNLRRKTRTTNVLDMFGGNGDEKSKDAPQSTKKAKDKPVPKNTRNKRCKDCGELFKNLDKHKCKGKK